ncbi:MAG: hypothetical protein HYT03_00575 [Candidatus Harrisonbacteria bacterium]|nr:hypothetical protein [Candidatus Harrisonbacteria bacterium]
MRSIGENRGEYLEELKRRSEEARVSKSYQLIGLEVAKLLGDWKHKALYIKLAKQYGEGRLMEVAKRVAERDEVKNKGAYFMKVFHVENSNYSK